MDSPALRLVGGEPQECTRLDQLEAEIHALIEAGRQNFYQIGIRAREIRDGKDYVRERGVSNFVTYCFQEFGWRRTHVDRVISAVEIVEILTPMGVKNDLTERVVRPLTKLRIVDDKPPRLRAIDPDAVIECFLEAQKHAAQEEKPVAARHVAAVVRDRLGEEQSWLIKPSDNWNFSPVFYGRIDGEEGHGYVPGEVYANCLFYYTKPGDVVVDPMAGGGQIFRVYEDRARWMRPEPWDLDIYGFDLTPRGQYAHRITAHNLRQRFPMDHADYIVMDVPYFGMVDQAYSDSPDDLANMPIDQWETSITAIAIACATAQKPGYLCTVISPNFRDTSTGQIILAPRLIQQAFVQTGYVLHDIAYQSRRIQQQQTPNMAHMNNFARAQRIMLTDMSEILTFRFDSLS
jgi:ParB family chromosome partitioning protein